MAMNSKGCNAYILGTSATLTTGWTLSARSSTPRDKILCPTVGADFTVLMSTNCRLKFIPSSTLASPFFGLGYYRVETVNATSLLISGRKFPASLDLQTIGSSNVMIYNNPSGNLGDVVDFSINPSASPIDVTLINSTAKQKLVSVSDPGEFQLTLLTDTTFYRNNMAIKFERPYEIRFSDSDTNASTSFPSHITFDGKVLSVQSQGAVDDAYKQTVSILVTSALSISTATS